jgi:hypothetical protein
MITIAFTLLLTAAVPHPAPTLRPARANEIPNQEALERQHLLKGLFPGALGIPRTCAFERIAPTEPVTRYNLRLICEPSTWVDILPGLKAGDS